MAAAIVIAAVFGYRAIAGWRRGKFAMGRRFETPYTLSRAAAPVHFWAVICLLLAVSAIALAVAFHGR